MQPQRIFLIEPNLKKSYGHVVEFPFSIQSYIANVEKECIIVCNKEIDKNLLNTFKDTHPYISKTIFEDLNDSGVTFANDLKFLDDKFKFKNDDLIVILTGYTNEVLGAGKFMESKNKTTRQPKIAIWMHQLYPPTLDFITTLESQFKKEVMTKQEVAFDAISSFNNVYLFSTFSKELKTMLSRLSEKKVEMLPLPYNYSFLNNATKIDKKPLVFGFMGDGRYEKGLMTILEFIIKTKDTKNQYFIQDIFPRGYSDANKDKYNEIKEELRSYKNIQFISEPLLPKDYKNFIQSTDVFLLPYHPNSYDKRVSGICIEALLNGKVILTTDGTWLAKEVKKYDCGVVFKFDDNENTKLDNFQKSFEKLLTGYHSYAQGAKRASLAYQKIHSADNFVKILFKSIN